MGGAGWAERALPLPGPTASRDPHPPSHSPCCPAGRHLQNWGGIPTTSAGGMAAEPLPPFLAPLAEALVLSGAFPDNHPPKCA